MRILGLFPGQGGYRVLLWMLVALIVLRPIIEEFGRRTWLLPLLLTAVMLASVWSVARGRFHVIGIAIMVVVAVGGEWLLLGGYEINPVLPNLAMVTAFSWIAGVLAKDVFRDRDYISADLIYGAIDVYLLVGLAFAAAYRVLVVLVPGAIDGLSAAPDLGDTLYFSAITLTTLGYGDISPVTDGARMLAFCEALFGQLYIAVLLAKLVATHISSKEAGPEQAS